MKELITEKQLAELTGLAVQTIRNARHLRRGIPYIRIGGERRGAIRYSLGDVEAYLQAHRIDPEERTQKNTSERAGQ